MQQKTTWMRFLIFGFSIVFIAFLSCSKEEDGGSITTNFIYKNLLSENVEIKLYNSSSENFQNYTINPNSEIMISKVYSGPKTGVGEPFSYNFAVNEVIIKFETSNKCLVNYPKIRDPREYDNFTEAMYQESNNTLIYNIDDDEFDMATPCP